MVDLSTVFRLSMAWGQTHYKGKYFGFKLSRNKAKRKPFFLRCDKSDLSFKFFIIFIINVYTFLLQNTSF